MNTQKKRRAYRAKGRNAYTDEGSAKVIGRGGRKARAASAAHRVESAAAPKPAAPKPAAPKPAAPKPAAPKPAAPKPAAKRRSASDSLRTWARGELESSKKATAARKEKLAKSQAEYERGRKKSSAKKSRSRGADLWFH